ncbi:hypothetical protein [Candidatus Chloroploca asiatica]|uniref:hypothetical protein n=1 Tax=Candidatus Chloroploca asiatica TaxID=1506545 RepID=UPI001142CCE9|nr:hypothetical protein [Candidatus Chloroploca asiatica]
MTQRRNGTPVFASVHEPFAPLRLCVKKTTRTFAPVRRCVKKTTRTFAPVRQKTHHTNESPYQRRIPMTQTPPPTDDTQTLSFMPFDLGETIAPPPSAAAPPARETTPITTARSNKRSQRPAAKTTMPPTPAALVRLEITPPPALPELPPLQRAAVRTALCQALAAQAHTDLQALLASQPDDQTEPSLAIPPARLAAAARLLSASPALNAAVTLLALEATA